MTEEADSTTASAAEDAQSLPESEPERQAPGKVLRGATVAPGLVLGKAHRKDYDLVRSGAERVPLDEVDRELNRFRKALDDSRLQILDLKSRLAGRVPTDDARILDTHITYLKDSVFIADVENLILNEQMRLEAAIAKVVQDFDRIFRLVQTDSLRQSAVDLRDVGLRVLRNLERHTMEPLEEQEAPRDYVLVAKELSIVDMFNLSNEHVKGIVTRDGGLSSHAAILARSMRIPTVTGVQDLLEQVREGDFLILDATAGSVQVNPDELVRAQYAKSADEEEETAAEEEPEWSRRAAKTLDGVELGVAASCGNLPEVEQAAAYGMRAVGLYRTELLYLVDPKPPSRETLVHHYASVIGAARGAPVTFRLLNADSSLGLSYLHPEREANPNLGRVGVRALLGKESVLRRQIQAILIAGLGVPIRIAIPFVVDCGELRRIKEVLFEERLELRNAGERFQDVVEVGVVIDTPAAMLGVRDLAREADFLMLNLDSLQQYLLATDRDNPELSSALENLHPFVLRALSKAAEVADAERRPLLTFGASARTENNLPFLIGAGLRQFCVPPPSLKDFIEAVGQVDASQSTRAARAAIRSACPEETSSLVSGYRHGYAPG